MGTRAADDRGHRRGLFLGQPSPPRPRRTAGGRDGPADGRLVGADLARSGRGDGGRAGQLVSTDIRRRANRPQVTVEVGTDTFAAAAQEAEGEERDRLYRTMADRVSVFSEYAAKTERTIPVIVLTPVGDR